MQYSVARLAYSFREPWQREVFEQALCDAGFDAFVGDEAYIPTAVLSVQRHGIEALIGATEGVQLLAIEDCPEQDWNAQWEAEHPAMVLPMGVRITPRCAFGAGYHETTAMLMDALLQRQGAFRRVLDMGCGTGVLGILAKKCGAEQVVAVDRDEQSVRNTQENAAQNGVEIAVLQGDTPPEGKYDLILANIHRNTLLDQLPHYAQCLQEGGEAWLSGFYAADIAPLVERANEVGLVECGMGERGEWRMLRLRK